LTEAKVINRHFSPYGNAASLWTCTDREVLCESGAGTGKTYNLLQHANYVARKYANTRIWFVRETRKSLTQAVLKDWEEMILFPGHPAITGTASREHRDNYTYPNGTEISLWGTENPDRFMSAQADRIYIFEATGIQLDHYEKIISRLRAQNTPYQQVICDCNPQGPGHFLNVRANQLLCRDSRDRENEADHCPPIDNTLLTDQDECPGCKGPIVHQMARHKYEFSDNPILYDHDELGNPTGKTDFGKVYINGTLASLTGVRRKRLFEHLWAAPEGIIYEEYDADTHLVHAADLPEMKWYFAAMDFGYRAPGSLGVFGVDEKEHMYLVAEIYKTQKQMDWWAAKIEELDKEYNLIRIVADCAEPRFIDFLNDRLTAHRGRDVGGIVLKSDKTKGRLHGIDTVKWGLSQADGGPRLFFVRDALRFGVDLDLKSKSKPTRLVEEIGDFCWRETEDGKREKDEPDPNAADHATSMTEYACVWKWGKDYSSRSPKKGFEYLSYGDVLGHKDVDFDPT